MRSEDGRRADDILKKVIEKARAKDIPVPYDICGEVRINKRPKKRFGCCRRENGRTVIEISSFILECTDDKIEQVIAHEVLHACPGCGDHGAVWKKYAAVMNEAYGYDIKRVSTFEEMGLSGREEHTPEEDIRYIIKCTACGREYPRKRFTCVMQKINAYRCQCGGRLELITLDKEETGKQKGR